MQSAWEKELKNRIRCEKEKTHESFNYGLSHERQKRFTAWAKRLSHDELATVFAQLLAKHLIVRKNLRDHRRESENKIIGLKDELSECRNIMELFECVQQDQRDQRREGGKSKSKDKQAAKAAALDLWKERHAGLHKQELRTVEQFANEVMKRWPVLKSHKVICKWSADWTKQVSAKKNPTC